MCNAVIYVLCRDLYKMSRPKTAVCLPLQLSSSNANGHVSSQTCQLIVCFACPACYLLFNIRDECLQHMAAKNHFTHFISLGELKSSLVPIPVPRYVKNRLISLCKDVLFSVKCTACSRVLTSHMEAKAHFNVHCRQGCAIAEANQSVAQVMKQMMVLGHCTSCTKIFLRQRSMEEHREQTQHVVEAVNSVEQALLYYSSYCESRKGHTSKYAKATQAEPHRVEREKSGCLGSLAKRQRLSSSGSRADDRALTLAWFCECGLRYLEEDQASKHLLSANQIFHKCAICGKLMGESSIARLHMSRFHGGAHLSSFLFHCRLCKVEMPRMEDILAHVAVAHRGHTYYQEREDTMEKTSARPSPNPGSSAAMSEPAAAHPAPSVCEQRWLCRMCEDLFESEAAAHEHCSHVNSHSFQRFACGHCPQKFFKESTLRRHCANEHGGSLLLRYFCGLCDSMLYDSEREFQEHYVSLHSRDYYRLDQAENGASPAMESSAEAPTTSRSLTQLCPCMGSQRADKERKSLFTRCMKRLAGEGECKYVCRRCTVAASSYAEMKTHTYLKHEAQGKDKSFDVVCASCSESHRDVPSFHTHYHAQHCLQEPCVSSRSSGESKEKAPIGMEKARSKAPIGMILSAEDISVGRNAEEFQDVRSDVTSSTDVPVEHPKETKDNIDEDMKLALALSVEESKKPTEFDQEMEEALKRSLEEF